MKVSAAVQELERQLDAMRQRAERAEGTILVYEARDRAQQVARLAISSDEWVIRWKNGDEDPVEFSYSPGMWLLGLAETYLKHPVPFELLVVRKPAPEPAASTQQETN